jgi:Xaa-Pro aminopeptidase
MPGDFGVKLENILEVMDTGERHPSGSRFLAFRDATLVPFEQKLVDRAMMSVQEVSDPGSNDQVRDKIDF